MFWLFAAGVRRCGVLELLVFVMQGPGKRKRRISAVGRGESWWVAGGGAIDVQFNTRRCFGDFWRFYV